MDIVDISIQDIFNFIHPLINGGYVSDTIFLLCLTIIDTVLGVAWRVKQEKKILSKRLKAGLIFNLGLAFLPELLGVALGYVHHPTALIMCVIEAVTIFVACAQIQSILANAVLYGIKIPKWAHKIYEVIIEPEVQEKEKREQN